MTRMADRRLRLVLALSLAAFAVVVLRAAQIQVVDAAALSQKAVSQQRDVRRLPGLRGAILSATASTWPRSSRRRRSSRTRLGCAPAPRRRGHRPRPRLPPAQEAPPPQASQEAEVPAEPRVAGPRAGGRGSAAAGRRRDAAPAPARGRRPDHGPAPARHLDRHRADPLVPVPRARAAGASGTPRCPAPAAPRARASPGSSSSTTRCSRERPGRQVVVHDPIGQALETVQLQRPVPGRDVTLTLDTTIQAKVESVLAQTLKSSRAQPGRRGSCSTRGRDRSWPWRRRPATTTTRCTR